MKAGLRILAVALIGITTAGAVGLAQASDTPQNVKKQSKVSPDVNNSRAGNIWPDKPNNAKQGATGFLGDPDRANVPNKSASIHGFSCPCGDPNRGPSGSKKAGNGGGIIHNVGTSGDSAFNPVSDGPYKKDGNSGGAAGYAGPYGGAH